MKKGTLMIKLQGREELFWVLVFLLCCFVFDALSSRFSNTVAAVLMIAVVAAAAAVRYTVLRTFHIRYVDWTLTDNTLTIGEEELPRREIDRVFFQRNKLTGNSVYLNIHSYRTLRFESLGSPAKMRAESLDSMKELAFALDPTSAQTLPRH